MITMSHLFKFFSMIVFWGIFATGVLILVTQTANGDFDKGQWLLFSEVVCAVAIAKLSVSIISPKKSANNH